MTNAKPPITERERMLAGQPYDSRDPELLSLYRQAKRLLRAFEQAEDRQPILAELLGRVGRGVWIEAPFACDYGVNIEIGDECFINYNCVFLDCNRITIGSHVLLGPAVQLYTATHPLAPQERIVTGKPGYVTRALPINIGNNVWIGGGAMIMPGVSVGQGTTIGAGSVVTRDVPAGCFAAGNPCRVIRQL